MVTFTTVLVLLGVYAALMSTVAAIWSVLVALRYKRDKIQWHSHRRQIQLNVSRSSELMEEMAGSMVGALELIEARDPAALQDGLAEIQSLRESVEAIPKGVIQAFNGRKGGIQKGINHRERQLYADLDEAYSQEMKERALEGAGPIKRVAIEAFFENPDSRPLIEAYLQEKGLSIGGEGASHAPSVKLHPMDR